MQRLRTVCGKCDKFLFVPEYKATDNPEADISDKIKDHLKFHCSARREFFKNAGEWDIPLMDYLDELMETVK